MKILILVRHAKSSWDQIGVADFDRPLNDRGKKEAPEMAKRLKDKSVKIDLLISSPARRANKTAKYFAEEYGISKKEIALEEKLYEPSVSGFLDVLTRINDKCGSALIFSHNPGITEFANTLTTVHIDDMPTCGIFGIGVNTNKWTDFLKAEKNFLFFDYPKNPLA
jgi:phosphohistidine phosphatase